ncbi:MAG: S8/S53 family peptidase [Salibacteraceae bacterium]
MKKLELIVRNNYMFNSLLDVRFFINPLIILVFCLLGSQAYAQNSHVQNEVIIKLDNVEVEDYLKRVNQLFPELSAEFKETLSDNLNLHLISFNETVGYENSPLRKFTELPSCLLAQWNHTNIKFRKSPNDPSFVAQWSLKAIEAEKAWDISTGGFTKDNQQIVLAVIDDGFVLNQDDMGGRYWKNESEIPNNNIDDDNNGYVDDYHGWNSLMDTGFIYPFSNAHHGTKVMGLMGATTNNSQDMASINWNIKVMPIQMGNSVTESLVIKAYDYVLSQRIKYNRTGGDSGAFVVAANSSFGVDRGSRNDYPILCNLFDVMGDEGIISVGAGPNSLVNIDIVGDIPCTCASDYLISVTATNINDQIRFGYGFENMDIGAPGIDVISLVGSNSIGKVTGCSFAAPMVSAAIGLMYSAIPYDTIMYYQNKPDELAQKVRTLLLDNTKAIPTLENKSTTGGMLNLYRSVLAASSFNDVSASNGVVDFQNDLITIYPNPTNNIVSIQINNLDQSKYTLSLFSITGQRILGNEISSSETLEVNLQNLNKGVYYLRLSLEGNLVEVKKIVKQ